MATNIDADGATSEQSIGYASTATRSGPRSSPRWTPAASRRRRSRRASASCPSSWPGPARPTATSSSSATPPTTRRPTSSRPPRSTRRPSARLGPRRRPHARLLHAGYVFGRSSWSSLTTSMYYSLRFGPTMALHGHSDKTSVTYWVRGQQILTDSGHIGYTDTAARIYLRSTAAHNSVSTPPRTYLRQGLGPAVLTTSGTATSPTATRCRLLARPADRHTGSCLTRRPARSWCCATPTS